jgi:hypothetical protein
VTRHARRLTHAFVWLLLALALVDCGKYGRPSRIRSAAPNAPAATSTPAPAAEECEEPAEETP